MKHPADEYGIYIIGLFLTVRHWFISEATPFDYLFSYIIDLFGDAAILVNLWRFVIGLFVLLHYLLIYDALSLVYLCRYIIYVFVTQHHWFICDATSDLC